MDTVLLHETKNLGTPFNQLDHKNCLMWLTALKGGLRCQLYATLLYYMKREGKKQQVITPEQKAARTSIVFTCICHLSVGNKEEHQP